MSFSKLIIVVDEHVNVHDEQEVLFCLGANVDPKRDTVIAEGPLDILDHAAPFEGSGSKLGIDATRKIPGEEVNGQPVRDWPAYQEMDAATRALVEKRWREYGF